MSQSPKKE
jgi:hypothetical protein